MPEGKGLAAAGLGVFAGRLVLGDGGVALQQAAALAVAVEHAGKMLTGDSESLGGGGQREGGMELLH